MSDLSIAGSWTPDKDGVFQGEISEDWCQGRTAFGGLLTTAAVRATQKRLDSKRPLRSVLTAFVAPVSVGPAHIEVDLLRAGRSLTSLDATVIQADQVCTRVTACFGEGRDTCIQIAGKPRPEAPPPEKLDPMPYIPKVTPAFTQHFDFRLIAPQPVSGTKEPRIQGWIRAKDTKTLHPVDLLSLIDAWPPPEIITQDRPYPLSSITWQVNLLTALPEQGISPDAWWFFDSLATWANGGYSDSWAVLWAADGQPVAVSRQMVAEFSSDCSKPI